MDASCVCNSAIRVGKHPCPAILQGKLGPLSFPSRLFQLFQGVSALFQKCFIAVSSSVPRVSAVSRFFAFQPVRKLAALSSSNSELFIGGAFTKKSFFGGEKVKRRCNGFPFC